MAKPRFWKAIAWLRTCESLGTQSQLAAPLVKMRDQYTPNACDGKGLSFRLRSIIAGSPLRLRRIDFAFVMGFATPYPSYAGYIQARDSVGAWRKARSPIRSTPCLPQHPATPLKSLRSIRSCGLGRQVQPKERKTVGPWR